MPAKLVRLFGLSEVDLDSFGSLCALPPLVPMPRIDRDRDRGRDRDRIVQRLTALYPQDGLRSGLEAATSITGMPVPWGRGLPSPSPELRNASNSAPPATVTRDARNGHGPVAKQGLLLPQPQVTVPKGAFGRRVTGWARGLVEAVAVHAIAAFLRRTVVKVSFHA